MGRQVKPVVLDPSVPPSDLIVLCVGPGISFGVAFVNVLKQGGTLLAEEFRRVGAGAQSP